MTTHRTLRMDNSTVSSDQFLNTLLVALRYPYKYIVPSTNIFINRFNGNFRRLKSCRRLRRLW